VDEAPPPTGWRLCKACSKASNTKPACAVRLTRHPTMRRAYLTTTIVVTDADAKQANEKQLAIERIINGRGFVLSARRPLLSKCDMRTLDDLPCAPGRQRART
jgi:hypothetical protein